MDRPVLRMRGLPFTVAPEDIRAFFKPSKVLEVFLCTRDGGRPTGEAYVVLPATAEPDACLDQLNNKFIGARYIELFESTEADLQAVKRLLSGATSQGHVVRLRGLPYAAGEEDVRRFLSGARLADVPDAVVLAQAADGRPTGEAYVEMADEQAQGAALTRHKEVMGGRYIEVFNSSRMKKYQAFQQVQTNSRARKRPTAAQAQAQGRPVHLQQQQQLILGPSQQQHQAQLPIAAGSSQPEQLLHAVLQLCHAGDAGPACGLPYPADAPLALQHLQPHAGAVFAQQQLGAAASSQPLVVSAAAASAGSRHMLQQQALGLAQLGAGGSSGSSSSSNSSLTMLGNGGLLQVLGSAPAYSQPLLPAAAQPAAPSYSAAQVAAWQKGMALGSSESMAVSQQILLPISAGAVTQPVLQQSWQQQYASDVVYH